MILGGIESPEKPKILITKIKIPRSERVDQAKWPTEKKSPVWAIFFHSKHKKNIPMDSRDTRADPQRVKAQPWSISGPRLGPII